MSASIEQRNQEATCFVGNLDEKMTEEILWELMLQCGPVVNLHMPKDKVTGVHLNYGFVEFRVEEDAEYAIKILNMIKLYGKALKVNKASKDNRQLDVGANIYIGNLDPDVDEKLLYDTFSAFGGIQQTPKIMRDPDTSESMGYGFISFDSFEASDLAIECMSGQFLSNRAITCQYAYKKDRERQGFQSERHGSQAERLLAASQPQRFKPHTIFSAGEAGDVTAIGMVGLGAGMHQQMQMQQQQMGVDPYSQMMAQQAYQQHHVPLQMQMPMPMMPSAPGSLPGYMMGPGGGMHPPPLPQQMAGNYNMGMMIPPPPPQQYFQPQPQYHQQGFEQGFPPPPVDQGYGQLPPPPPPPSSRGYQDQYVPPPPQMSSHMPPPPPVPST